MLMMLISITHPVGFGAGMRETASGALFSDSLENPYLQEFYKLIAVLVQSLLGFPKAA